MNWWKLSQADDKYKLSDDAISKFRAIAVAQRTGPERTMREIQRFTGGNILNYIVEHGGDILHRITDKADMVHADPELRSGRMDIMWRGSQKVARCVGLLSQPYGFEREMNEGLAEKAKGEGRSLEEVKAELSRLLKKWGSQYAAIPAYNEMQRLARDFCVDIGDQKWDSALEKLQRFQAVAEDNERFYKEVFKYTS